MVSPSGPRQTRGPSNPIVAFDFDGTLTTRDSFAAFLRWRAGTRAYAAGRLKLAPAALLYLLDHDRGRLKAAAAKVFLGGMTREEMAAEAQAFTESHAPKLLRPDALRVWRGWQGQGARMTIVTASPDILVAPFARGLGAEVLIGTRLEFDESDRFTGRLAGTNCRGPEKVRRLHEVFGEDLRLEAAYGDTDGDREMLAIAAEQGFKAFRGKP